MLKPSWIFRGTPPATYQNVLVVERNQTLILKSIAASITSAATGSNFSMRYVPNGESVANAIEIFSADVVNRSLVELIPYSELVFLTGDTLQWKGSPNVVVYASGILTDQ